MSDVEILEYTERRKCPYCNQERQILVRTFHDLDYGDEVGRIMKCQICNNDFDEFTKPKDDPLTRLDWRQLGREFIKFTKEMFDNMEEEFDKLDKERERRNCKECDNYMTKYGRIKLCVSLMRDQTGKCAGFVPK